MSDDSILREKARKALQAGNLPWRRPHRMWGGSGEGAQCTVCGTPVKHNEVDLEVEFTWDDGAGATNHHFHIRCFSALESELHDLQLARQTTSPSDQTQSATAAPLADGQNGT